MNKQQAKQVCASWHRHEDSALHQYGKTGEFEIINLLKYFQEIEYASQPEYHQVNPNLLSSEAKAELKALKKYFLKVAQGYGFAISFRKHEVYGYLIPFIAKHPEGFDSSEVEQLRYAV